MEGGAKTRIDTGQPVMDPKGQAAEKAARKEARDREKTADLGLDQTEAGRRLVNMTVDLLYRRVKKLIDEDDEAAAYVKLLRELDGKIRAADKAMERIADRNYKRIKPAA